MAARAPAVSTVFPLFLLVFITGLGGSSAKLKDHCRCGDENAADGPVDMTLQELVQCYQSKDYLRERNYTFILYHETVRNLNSPRNYRSLPTLFALCSHIYIRQRFNVSRGALYCLRCPPGGKIDGKGQLHLVSPPAVINHSFATSFKWCIMTESESRLQCRREKTFHFGEPDRNLSHLFMCMHKDFTEYPRNCTEFNHLLSPPSTSSPAPSDTANTAISMTSEATAKTSMTLSKPPNATSEPPTVEHVTSKPDRPATTQVQPCARVAGEESPAQRRERMKCKCQLEAGGPGRCMHFCGYWSEYEEEDELEGGQDIISGLFSTECCRPGSVFSASCSVWLDCDLHNGTITRGPRVSDSLWHQSCSDRQSKSAVIIGRSRQHKATEPAWGIYEDDHELSYHRASCKCRSILHRFSIRLLANFPNR